MPWACDSIEQTLSYWGSGRSSVPVFLGFHGGSDSRESACNAGHLGSIPGFGRSLWRILGELHDLFVLSCDQLFETPWTVTHQVLCPWDSSGKNPGVGCHFLLQEIFLTQGSNLCLLGLLHWQADSLPLSHWGRIT